MNRCGLPPIMGCLAREGQRIFHGLGEDRSVLQTTADSEVGVGPSHERLVPPSIDSVGFGNPDVLQSHGPDESRPLLRSNPVGLPHEGVLDAL